MLYLVSFWGKRKDFMKRSFKFILLFLLLFLILFLLFIFFIDYNKNIASASIPSSEYPMSMPFEELDTSNTTISQNVLPTEVLSEAVSESEAALIHPNRITYRQDFYSEPISDEIKERINGLSYKKDCSVPYEELRYLRILYTDFEKETQVGEIICNKSIANDLLEIFYELHQTSYPIEKIQLIDEYEADDDLSCLANNTSCFNYRVVEGSTKLSKHALGLAIDINPVYNPYVTFPNGEIRISPVGSEAYADRTFAFPYKIDENDLCYKLFMEHGFTWGGNWNSLKDYQHFQKNTK